VVGCGEVERQLGISLNQFITVAQTNHDTGTAASHRRSHCLAYCT